jgi:hypothetical protein
LLYGKLGFQLVYGFSDKQVVESDDGVNFLQYDWFALSHNCGRGVISTKILRKRYGILQHSQITFRSGFCGHPLVADLLRIAYKEDKRCGLAKFLID